MSIRNLPTHFGTLDVSWEVTGNGATLRLARSEAAGGFMLSLPESLSPGVRRRKHRRETERGFVLPAGTRQTMSGSSL